MARLRPGDVVRPRAGAVQAGRLGVVEDVSGLGEEAPPYVRVRFVRPERPEHGECGGLGVVYLYAGELLEVLQRQPAGTMQRGEEG